MQEGGNLVNSRNKAVFALLRNRNKGIGVRSVKLLRHGAHSDVGARLTGRGKDNGLTETGRLQALAAASALRSEPPSAIYVSPRRRTRDTAEIIGNELGVPISISDALDEVDFGAWTGRTFEQLAADPAWTEWNAQRGTAPTPGGETQSAAQARALAFLFEVAAEHQGSALLVTHCDIIRSLVCWAERRSLNEIHAISCEPGSLLEIELVARAEAA